MVDVVEFGNDLGSTPPTAIKPALVWWDFRKEFWNKMTFPMAGIATLGHAPDIVYAATTIRFEEVGRLGRKPEGQNLFVVVARAEIRDYDI
ncbi:hypothetical protein M7I_0154 [Glarea lozoyensis 74030]|uniref:Uncharacterized protein n=1 Tax=Glarea lozoyensis (strain ATCC 74030 / MF5533) TaxID=1104152 RepID=H0ECL2_GLAL7|nr:hypothetical protein M7I_0154 [Glarea lozoyensis 74030]